MSELYDFHTRDFTDTRTHTWRYTDAKRTLTTGVLEWTPARIVRDRWSRTIQDAETVVTIPADLYPAPYFRQSNPPTNLWLTVTDTDGHPTHQFTGKVIRAKFTYLKNDCKLTVTTAARLSDAEVPWRRFNPTCGWPLYGEGCGLTASAYKVTVPTSEVVVSGLTLQHADLASKPNGWFDHGFAKCGSEEAFIVAHDGDTVTLIVPFVAASSSNFEFYAGCDKTYDTCNSRFGNLNRFGGFGKIPAVNPTMSGF